MIVLVCGSRTWGNRRCDKCAAPPFYCRGCTSQNLLDEDAIEREFILHELSPDRDILIEGEANGADKLSRTVAENRGWPQERILKFPAQWDRYGKSAGLFRNQQMLDQQPDLVLAFTSDLEESVGTRHMVRIARAAGVPVEVFNS